MRVGSDRFYRIRLTALQLMAACDMDGGSSGTALLRGAEQQSRVSRRECAARRPRPWNGPWGDRSDVADASRVGGTDAVLDSGSSYSYVPRAALDSIIDSIQAECWGEELPSGAETDHAKKSASKRPRRCAGSRVPRLSLPSGQVFCVRLEGVDSARALASFPSLVLFSERSGSRGEKGDMWVLPPSSLLLKTPWSAGLHCLQIFDAEEVGGRVILGTNAMLDKDVAFLADQGRLEWRASDCAMPLAGGRDTQEMPGQRGALASRAARAAAMPARAAAMPALASIHPVRLALLVAAAAAAAAVACALLRRGGRLSCCTRRRRSSDPPGSAIAV